MHFPNDITVNDDAVVRGEVANVEGLWATNLRALDRIARFTRDRGATMVLVALPSKSQVFNGVDERFYQDRLRAYARDRGVRFVDLLQILPPANREPLYWTWDPHFTAEGHRAAAEALFAAVSGESVRQDHQKAAR